VSHIHELRDVIYRMHGVSATHVKSVPVTEKYHDLIAWDGVVEVFRLTGHPKTHKVYAWVHDTDDPKHPQRYVTVLHIPPVVSPETAVRAAIVQESRERDRSKEN
jgi:hypothetical protein